MFTFVIGGLPSPLHRWHGSCDPSGTMKLYLSDSAAVADAADLIARHGTDAEFEAAALANKSRDIGNHLHFCRWRQIERLIVLLGCDEAVGTVH